jgi:1,4-alpha-glucan branching enzyme
MRLRFPSGIWELFVPRLDAGARYKFDIVGAGGMRLPAKADPVAQQAEPAPATASVVTSPHPLRWSDDRWMASRAGRQSAAAPISIYEVHIGSWMRPTDGDRASPWDVATERLIPPRSSFPHVELLPIAEHPRRIVKPPPARAPSARFGSPSEAFARFVDALHGGHRCDRRRCRRTFPRREWPLARFDGSAHEYLRSA